MGTVAKILMRGSIEGGPSTSALPVPASHWADVFTYPLMVVLESAVWSADSFSSLRAAHSQIRRTDKNSSRLFTGRAVLTRLSRAGSIQKIRTHPLLSTLSKRRHPFSALNPSSNAQCSLSEKTSVCNCAEKHCCSKALNRQISGSNAYT